MASIGEVKKRLPKEFIDRLYKQFTPITADKILYGMGSERLTTLRVNTLKYDRQSLMNDFRRLNIKFDRVMWYEDAFIIKNMHEKEISQLDIYKNGYIYLQSLSSMIPPILLNPKKGEKILDMAASPGSKTTQIAALMENQGKIIANEVDKIRAERLKYNLSLQGVKIADVRLGRGEKIKEEYKEEFDRVLLDTPCSGEGRFIFNEPITYKSWSLKEVNRLSNLQKKLIESGFKVLKKGGTLVYSTCTLNLEENENIVEYACSNLGLKIDKIEIDFKINNINNNGGMLKILPSKDMEGFFLCKLKKL
ncbi:16S rRNA (cytosine1407-C5)-methyltransferase/ribosomal RNA methyltransferase Nop2 [Caloramator quimbayensis]|uniref:16S rRNA (Cytosine1407-C5)-methyltransferase/ribosomal RNA methyltransferase Nop2 n=1 Tax=Caloramator quimbayensis TaxID=1147123 RepID=A0A1T4X261_9CLOT|nr:RsmB/NOP family class I SAM-dependent RNA methyltransferase [Caloramator quimbayensis]SKA83733.1 16S rRNA (cytosine1407-C5)-methyltransferase/ribosomal RNA methyltransferase Nop2 [Caloramator quimbayensis]